MSDTRLSEAARLLRENGLGEARIEARGFQGEIASLSAEPGALPRLRALAPALKRLGFRYVALELSPADGEGDR